MDWNSSILWGIIGLVGGFIISFFFYFIGLKRKHLSYNIKTICLVSDKINQINGLEIRYNSNEIEDLYFSTITIKNIGNAIIENSDFAALYPLSISTNGIFLIDELNEIELYSSNKSSVVQPLFDIDNDGICNYIIISFDYISKKEELTCSILHTGNIIFEGTLKEGRLSINPFSNFPSFNNTNKALYYLVMCCIIITILTISTFLGFYKGVMDSLYL